MSTSGVVPIILISSIISIAIEIFIRARPTRETLQDSTLCSAKVAKTLCHIAGKTSCPSLSFSTGSPNYQCLLAVSQLQANQSDNSC